MKVTVDIPTKLLLRMLRVQAASYLQDAPVEKTTLEAIKTGVWSWEQSERS